MLITFEFFGIFIFGERSQASLRQFYSLPHQHGAVGGCEAAVLAPDAVEVVGDQRGPRRGQLRGQAQPTVHQGLWN